MKKRSKVSERMREKLIESARRMSPEERLIAYAEHSRLVMEIRSIGKAFRSK